MGLQHNKVGVHGTKYCIASWLHIRIRFRTRDYRIDLESSFLLTVSPLAAQGASRQAPHFSSRHNLFNALVEETQTLKKVPLELELPQLLAPDLRSPSFQTPKLPNFQIFPVAS